MLYIHAFRETWDSYLFVMCSLSTIYGFTTHTNTLCSYSLYNIFSFSQWKSAENRIYIYIALKHRVTILHCTALQWDELWPISVPFLFYFIASVLSLFECKCVWVWESERWFILYSREFFFSLSKDKWNETNTLADVRKKYNAICNDRKKKKTL